MTANQLNHSNHNTPTMGGTMARASTIDTVKRLLVDPHGRILLDDLVTNELKEVLERLDWSNFSPFDEIPHFGVVMDRIYQYRDAIKELGPITALLAQWGGEEHMPTLRRIFARLAELHDGRHGNPIWLDLRWYPLMTLLYLAGINALAAENWSALKAIYSVKAVANHAVPQSVALQITGAMTGNDQDPRFALLLGPSVFRTDLLHEHVAEVLEGILFLGTSYDTLFERFEVINAINYADIAIAEGTSDRVPFIFTQGDEIDFVGIVAAEREARAAGSSWPPVQAGLFRGSLDNALLAMAWYQKEFPRRYERHYWRCSYPTEERRLAMLAELDSKESSGAVGAAWVR